MIRLPDSADLATHLFRALEQIDSVRTIWHDMLHAARHTPRTTTRNATLTETDADTVTLSTVAVNDSVDTIEALTDTIVEACGTHLLLTDTAASHSDPNPPITSQPEPATPIRKGVEHLSINAKAKPNINKPYRRTIMPSTALKGEKAIAMGDRVMLCSIAQLHTTWFQGVLEMMRLMGGSEEEENVDAVKVVLQ